MHYLCPIPPLPVFPGQAGSLVLLVLWPYCSGLSAPVATLQVQTLLLPKTDPYPTLDLHMAHPACPHHQGNGYLLALQLLLQQSPFSNMTWVSSSHPRTCFFIYDEQRKICGIIIIWLLHFWLSSDSLQACPIRPDTLDSVLLHLITSHQDAHFIHYPDSFPLVCKHAQAPSN